MKAAILQSQNSPLAVVGDLELSAPGRGQVLVRLAYSGVCHSQLMEIEGKRGPDAYLPHLLGHEGSGVVEAVGEGVTKVKPGDRVILGWIKGSGLEGGGSKHRCGHDIVNAGGVTTFSEHSIVSENRCTILPKGVPMDVAVLFGCALPTGAGIVMNQLRPAPGSTIAIFGLGGIGLSALMATRMYGFTKTIVVDVSPGKLKLAAEFGATHPVDANAGNVVKEIRALTAGNGVDFSVDASGVPAVIEQAFDSVRRNGGLCVFASHPPAGAKIQLDPYELICGKRLEGSWGGASNPDVDIPKLANLYVEGKLPLEKLITKRYPLDDINDAVADLRERRVARPLIEIGRGVGA